MRKLFSVFIIVLMLILPSCGFGKTPVHSRPCQSVFEMTLLTLNAKGMWNCLSLPAKISYFQENGWNNDADIQKYFTRLAGYNDAFTVIEFSGNPVKLPSSHDSKLHIAFLYYITLVDATDYQTQVGRAFSLTVILDDQGKILEID